jgi:hypothetical protein
MLSAAALFGANSARIGGHDDQAGACRTKERTMNAPGRFVMSSLAVLLLAAASSPAAAQPTDCETSGSIGKCMGDLLAAQDDLIDELETMLDSAKDMNLFSLGRDRFGLDRGPDLQQELADRVESLRRENGRGKAANLTNTDEDYDEMIDQGDTVKGKKCKMSDIPFYESLAGSPPPGLRSTGPKFGDTKCNVFDAVDENGNSVRVNERRENMCERVCEEKKVGGQGQKGKSKERLIGRMSDGISASQSAAKSLRAHSARVTELGYLVSRLQLAERDFGALKAGNDDVCDSGVQIPVDLIVAEAINVVIVGLDVAVTAGNLITEILDTIKDVTEDVCQQDAAGFNGSSGCIPLTVAVHVSKGITDVLDGIKGGLGSTRDIILLGGEIVRSFQTDTLQTCTKEIKTDTDTLKSELTKLKADVGQTNDALVVLSEELAMVRSLVEANRDLLLTPQGRRDGFGGK